MAMGLMKPVMPYDLRNPHHPGSGGSRRLRLRGSHGAEETARLCRWPLALRGGLQASNVP